MEFLDIYQTASAQFSNVVVREVKILNQFGGYFQEAIAKNNTSTGICGYIVAAVAPFLAHSVPYVTNPSELEEILDNLNEVSFVVPKVGKCMEILRDMRTKYIKENAEEFKSEKEEEEYVGDLVAKYEIGDMMEILSSTNDNMFFLRYSDYQFPEFLGDVKHEEKKRLQKEEKFKQEKFIVDSFFEKRASHTISEWIELMEKKSSTDSEKASVFVGDMMGHYIIFLACKVKKEDGSLEDTIFLMNSIKETVCQLAFPKNTKI